MDTASGAGIPSSAGANARALELAYRYLNHRERTIEELRRHLMGRDLEASAVDMAVAELTELGYVDDDRFARLFAQDKRELQGWGSARIRSALLGRGIDRDLVDEALAEPADASAGEDASPGRDGEFERAVAVLEQRFPDPPRERRERERALGMLLRRGYEPELALDVIAAYSRRDA
jgi:regulatory protein